jgi:hypothetical protein
MRGGVNVIVEKPMEITRAAIAEMLRVQQETGVKMIGAQTIGYVSAFTWRNGLCQNAAPTLRLGVCKELLAHSF